MNIVQSLRADYDALVVGARCAGAATAMLLARAGLRVLAIERGAYGSDTLSTLALMRGGVLQLHRWGILDAVRAVGTPAVKTTSFHYGDEQIEIPIKSRDGVDALYAPRRTLLDARLVDAARASGATVVHGPRMASLVRGAGERVVGALVQDRGGETREIRAGIVIGADGIGSTVARLAGAGSYHAGRHASGVIYSYWRDVPLEGYHWWYRDGASAGTIPTNDGMTCVFVSVSAARFAQELRHDLAAAHRRVLTEVSTLLARHVGEGAQAARWHGFAGRTGFMRQSWGAGWALVGDAGYFKDPITAHGITDALRDAESLALAVCRGTDAALAAYQDERDALAQPLFEITDEIASYEWDMPRVRELHHALSREMQREVADMQRRSPVATSHAANL